MSSLRDLDFGLLNFDNLIIPSRLEHYTEKPPETCSGGSLILKGFQGLFIVHRLRSIVRPKNLFPIQFFERFVQAVTIVYDDVLQVDE